jgi:XTP/dITP diphosphohydrolase
VPAEERRERFVCVVAIVFPDGTVLNTSEGTCAGRIIFAPRGTGGFGYDPLFVPDGFEETFAELSDSVKNQISHRAHALLKTREFLLSEKAHRISEQIQRASKQA